MSERIEKIKKDPEIEAIVTESGQLITTAQAFKIVNADGYASAGGTLTRIKDAMKKLLAKRKKITDPIDEAKKEVMDLFRDPQFKLETAEKAIKTAMIDYQDEQERIQRELQRKADEDARKQREKLLEQSRKAEAKGQTEKAAMLEIRSETVAAPVVQREVPKVAGVGTRTVWDYQVDDASKIPREYLMVDEAKIRKVVQALKGDTVIAGVRVFEKKQIAAGRT